MNNTQSDFKKEMLDSFYKEFGDFDIFYKQGNAVWPTWVKYSSATPQDQMKCNLRGLHSCEIILDIEDKAQLPEIEKKLQEIGYSYAVWDTGSRGYHVHLVFMELKEYSENDRKTIRKIFIMDFGADPLKQTGLLALEGELHFKGTGRKKSLLRYIEGHRKSLEGSLLDRFRSMKTTYTGIISEFMTDWIKNDAVLQYCLNNKIPDGTGRYATLVKNLGIGLGLSGAKDEDISSIIDQLCRNMPGRTPENFWGWIRAARAGRFTNYNRRELLKWFKEHEVDLDG